MRSILFISILVFCLVASSLAQVPESGESSPTRPQGTEPTAGPESSEKKAEQKPSHFERVYREPDYREDMFAAIAAEQAALRNLKIPENLTEAMLDAWVVELGGDETTTLAERKLELAGQRAVPALLRALKHHHTASKAEDTEGRISDWLLVPKLTELLMPWISVDVLPVIEPLTRHEDDYVRCAAAGVVAGLGQADGADLIAQVILRQRSEYSGGIRFICEGLTLAISKNRLSPELRARVLDLAGEALRDADWRDHEAVIHLIDAVASQEFEERVFTSELLDAKHPAALSILSWCLFDERSPSWKLLHPIVTSEELRDADHPRNSLYNIALALSARKPGDETEACLRRALEEDAIEARIAAAQGLARLAGVKDPYEHIDKLGLFGLKDVHEHYMTVQMYIYEVQNGGHAQYFFNSSGDFALLAYKACREIGAPKAASILRRAAKVFGKSAPSTDREKRWKQLDKLTDADLETWSALDDEFYACDEELELQLALHVLKHAKDFQD